MTGIPEHQALIAGSEDAVASGLAVAVLTDAGLNLSSLGVIVIDIAIATENMHFFDIDTRQAIEN